MERVKVGIIGPGNIGTDLMYKVMRSQNLEMKTMTGIVESEGIRRAAGLGFHTSIEGVKAVAEDPEIGIVFDATGAAAHMKHAPILKAAGKIVFDMTPAAVGPFVVPCVNLDHLQELNTDNYNMVTCGGQATIPIAYAINRENYNILVNNGVYQAWGNIVLPMCEGPEEGTTYGDTV